MGRTSNMSYVLTLIKVERSTNPFRIHCTYHRYPVEW